MSLFLNILWHCLHVAVSLSRSCSTCGNRRDELREDPGWRRVSQPHLERLCRAAGKDFWTPELPGKKMPGSFEQDSNPPPNLVFHSVVLSLSIRNPETLYSIRSNFLVHMGWEVLSCAQISGSQFDTFVWKLAIAAGQFPLALVNSCGLKYWGVLVWLLRYISMR